jgi:NRPS condensation-like uncharacterized protein
VFTRTPLNVVDQFILDLDQEPEPWSVHCEVRVRGRLDGERVAAAALAAAARHPIARARLASFRQSDQRYFWEIAEQVEHLPLEILECPDDTGVEEARARLLSLRVGLESAPPFALILAHHPGGDSLIMNLHHAAGDGMSSYRLMTSICRAYAGIDDPVPDVDPMVIRDLREHASARSVKDRVMRLRGLGERVSESLSEGPAARVAVQGGRAGAEGFRFHLLRFGPEETREVMARRCKPATVNDLLVAALGIAVRRFNDVRGLAPARVSVMMPVNLRPAEWSQEIVSNIVSFVSVSVPLGEQTDLSTAQLTVAERTRVLKDQHQSGTMVDILGMLGIWPVGVRHLATQAGRPMSNQVLDTVVLSNLGRLNAPLDFRNDAGTAAEIWFSPPGHMPLGTAIGAATMNGELFLTIRYCEAQYDPAGAAAFADTWRDVLLDR